jgi:hypothetical protein
MSRSGDTTVSISIFNDGFISNNYYSVFTLNSDLTTRWNDFAGYDGSFTTVHGLSSLPGQDVYTIAYYDMYTYSVNLKFRVTSVRKHAPSGMLTLDSLYNFNCITTAVSITTDGGAIISATQDSASQNDLVLIRLDRFGNLVWKKLYGSYLSEEANSVIQTHDNGFAFLATVADPVIPGQHDMVLIKTNANGDSLWSRKFGGVYDEKALHIEEDSTSLILMGSTSSFGNDRIMLIKADSMGVIESSYVIVPDGRYFCENDTATLLIIPPPTQNLNITWSDGSTLIYNRVTTTGNYSAVISDTLGNAVYTSFVPVYFSKYPDSRFGTDTIRLCAGSPLIDTAVSEVTNSYQWFFNNQFLQGENAPSIVPQQTGSYSLVVHNYCLDDTSTSYVDTLFSLPLKPVISSLAINFVCPGDSLLLSSSPTIGEAYQWYTAGMDDLYPIPGATDTLYFAKENGNFLVKATNVNGCSAYSLPKPVTYDLYKEIINHNGPSTFCQGGEVELSVINASNLHWSNGDTSQVITVDTSGNFFASFININNCPKNSDTITITVLPNPVINLGRDTNLCSGEGLIIDAGFGFTNYFWNNGSSGRTLLAIPGDTIFPDTSDFIVFVTDSSGCTDSDTLRIVFDICNGINNSVFQSVQVYPNPVLSGKPLYIFNSLKSTFTLIISDLSNREIDRENLKGSISYYDTGILKTGIYIYRIFFGETFVSKGKLVVQ